MRIEDLQNIKRRESWEERRRNYEFQKEQRKYFRKIAGASAYDEANKIANEYLKWAGYEDLSRPDPEIKKMINLARILSLFEREAS